jgi:ActR/RegA family two-component response regulator
MLRENSGPDARPRLLLGYSDSAHASRCVRHFRRHGWQVKMVASGLEVQRLAALLHPHLIVLDVDLADENGWVSAAKILQAQPAQRVVLLGGNSDALRERARSLGAIGLVPRELGPEALTALANERQFSVAV